MRLKRNVIRPQAAVARAQAALGHSTKNPQQSPDGRHKATASGIPLRNTSVSQLPIEIDIDPLLKDIIFSEDLEQKKLVMRIYKDIYYNDPIGGSCVDLYSTLPFSDINLGGVVDRRASRAFEEAMERLNMVSLMPEMSVDLMVTGAFVGSLLPNSSKNMLADLIPYQYENCKVDPLPFFSQDPLITVAMPESYKTVLTSNSPRVEKLRGYLGQEVVTQLTTDALELDPITTMYVPRKSFTNSTGVSFFRRILPLWLMEKNLFRGTLVETARRQRGILHLVLGDGDQWIPTMADMQMAMELFQNADADPLGAVIATRMGIDTNEIRCLSGDMIVSTREGLVKIGSIVEHSEEELPFSARVDLEVKGAEGVYEEVDQWHYQGVKQTYKVSTKFGTNIIGTKNHKNLVLTTAGKLVKRTIGNTEIGDFLVTESNGVEQKEINTPLMLTMPEVGYRKIHDSITIPKVMTEELAYVIGMVVAEGYVSPRGVSITNTDMDILEKFSMCFEKVFGLKVRQRKLDLKGGKIKSKGKRKDIYSAGVASLIIVDLFKQLGVMTSKEGRELMGGTSPCLAYVIPESIMQAGRKCKLAFLAAMVDGDGSVVIDKSSNYNAVSVKFNSFSEDLIEGIRVMLSDMGYHSTAVGTRVDCSLGVSSRLYNDFNKYLAAERKKPFAACDDAVEYGFGIPASVFMPELLERYVGRGPRALGGSWFINDEGENVHVPGPFKYTFRHYDKAKSPMLYSAYEKGAYEVELNYIRQVSVSLHRKMLKLFRLKYRFEEIVSIKKHKIEPVYDLSIKGNEKGKSPLFVANGVVTSNSGGDFWKVTDMWDSTMSMKLRALGISESFLSGEANYSNADTSLTVFMESLRSYRDKVTTRVFYNKLFPLISAMNGFTVNDRGKFIKKDSLVDKMSGVHNHNILDDGTRLLIPSVHWTKQLKPEGDQAYMDMLVALTEKGVPVPLRAMAAAGGFNLNALLADQDDDFEMLKRIGEYQSKLAELKKAYMPKGEDDDDMGGFAAAASAMGAEMGLNNIASGTRSAVLAKGMGRMSPLHTRDFGEAMEVHGETTQGKRRYLTNQKLANERVNRKIAKALATAASRNNTPLTRTTVARRVE